MFGDGFLKFIKMVIGLIVFCVVVSGMVNVGDLKKVGWVGLKVVVYFEVMMMFVFGIGFVFVWFMCLGVGMNIDLCLFDVVLLLMYVKNVESLKDMVGYLMKIIFEIVIDVFVKGDIL